jgi:uncharacterized membrane protein YfcA
MFSILVAVVAALAAGIASIAGFGIGSLLTPLLASRYDMKTAVGAVAIPHVIATVLRFWRLRVDVDWKVLRGFGVMNAVGALLGALIHTRVNSPVLSMVLGILLVFAGSLGLLGYADRMRFGKTTAWIAGAVSGVFGGLVGNQGGIRSAAMLGLGVEGPAFVATATAIGIAVDAVRMPIYFATESTQIFRAWPAIVAGVIGVVFGTLVGERILRRIPQRIFRRIVSAILVCVGIYLLATSGLSPSSWLLIPRRRDPDLRS